MTESHDIIETATKAGNYQVFTKAVSDAGLKQALKNDGPFTIFAPTDAAFAKVPSGKLDDLLKPEHRETLQLLLRNHIVPGKLMSSELKDLDTTKTAQGEDLKIESRAGLWINEARVVSPDLEASNGVLHGIDTGSVSSNRRRCGWLKLVGGQLCGSGSLSTNDRRRVDSYYPSEPLSIPSTGTTLNAVR